MKNSIFYILLLLLVAILSVLCFKNWNKTDCCKEYPYEMHISAMSLMRACQDLVDSNEVTICDAGPGLGPSYITISAMSASGYGYKGNIPYVPKPGVVSFTVTYYKDSSIFRPVWQYGNFDSLPKVCGAPRPNIFPFTPLEQNHNFQLGLIPVADYQAAPGDHKKFTVYREGPPGKWGTYVLGVIKTDSITAIENIRLEPATGYISTNEPAFYNNLSSSKGFVCDVSYIGDNKDTITTPCYIINNNEPDDKEKYNDNVGSLWWKLRKKCQ